MKINITVTGLVQGVGFRPFVFRLAHELGLTGYVLNNTTGVLIEAEGEKKKLDEFLVRIHDERPEISKIYSLQHRYLEETGFERFEIRESNDKGDAKAFILPDIAVCNACLDDVVNPKDRRFMYPFTNCTDCGPRFTIIEDLPYDRKNTCMKSFAMCPDCEKEYSIAAHRRFHAQPNACHECGPWISLHDRDGQILCERNDALEKATALIRKGYIIAVKGIGGYHLICDATNEQTVREMRKRKHRDEKPMAVMFPDLESLKSEAVTDTLEERAITSIERPVVIVRKKPGGSVADSVSPDNSTIGVFLPYAPLHYLMLRKLKGPAVATSANITDDPIAKDEPDAFARLSTIADYFLSHNRVIRRRCDDSVVRIVAGQQVPVRRSRGFAPLPVDVPFSFKKPVLALGPNMNSTIAVGVDNRVYLSQHIGDLDTPLAMEFFDETVQDFLSLIGVTPDIAVADLHPAYYSRKYGERHFKERLITAQHHFAHIVSCMIENAVPEDAEVIGFAFDGTGYGPDHTIWGSEVMIASYRGFRRVFHLRPYRLPGGDKSVKEPCRTAFSLLHEAFGDKASGLACSPLSDTEKAFYLEMMQKNVNSPVTTSMGRVFDAVASLINLTHKISYHAQAAIALEQLAVKSDVTSSYPFIMGKEVIDQTPVIDNIVGDLYEDVRPEAIAKKFHNTVTEMIIQAAEVLRTETGISRVVLSGGVFQNAILLESAYGRLHEKGFTTLIHQLVPPNDGGISLGQAVYSHFL
jgi:hydrogenase maturation protein HypF